MKTGYYEKGYGYYKIGEEFFIEGKRFTITDNTIVYLHDNPNDYRTKKVPTVVYVLFDDYKKIEYRKTAEQLSELSKEKRVSL